MEDIKVGGHVYRTVKLDVFKQAHIARRLLPVVAAIGDLAITVFKEKAKEKANASVSIAEIVDKTISAIIEPLTHAFSQLSDKDSEYVLRTCMSVCMRKQDAGYAPLATPDGLLMFHDIDLKSMLHLTVIVVKENLSNFFPEPAQT